MVVKELIEMLEGMDQDAVVLFASQPAWPFEYSIRDVVEVYPPNEDEAGRHAELPDFGDEPTSVVYLVEGTQLGYLPRHVKSEIGWSRY